MIIVMFYLDFSCFSLSLSSSFYFIFPFQLLFLFFYEFPLLLSCSLLFLCLFPLFLTHLLSLFLFLSGTPPSILCRAGLDSAAKAVAA